MIQPLTRAVSWTGACLPATPGPCRLIYWSPRLSPPAHAYVSDAQRPARDGVITVVRNEPAFLVGTDIAGTDIAGTDIAGTDIAVTNIATIVDTWLDPQNDDPAQGHWGR